MYTINAVESVHYSYCKVIQKGAFPHERMPYQKSLYLRTKELEDKWEGGHIQQWTMV